MIVHLLYTDSKNVKWKFHNKWYGHILIVFLSFVCILSQKNKKLYNLHKHFCIPRMTYIFQNKIFLYFYDVFVLFIELNLEQMVRRKTINNT